MGKPGHETRGGATLPGNPKPQENDELFSAAGAAAFNLIIDESIASGFRAPDDYGGEEPDYDQV
jgi:hypothetical protein